jgi:hypothetical protein
MLTLPKMPIKAEYGINIKKSSEKPKTQKPKNPKNKKK